MTKRDYDLIAACIKAHVDELQATDTTGCDADVMQAFTVRLVNELINTNRRFSVGRFLAACGWKDKTEA